MYKAHANTGSILESHLTGHLEKEKVGVLYPEA
jgi:hypothetical protein